MLLMKEKNLYVAPECNEIVVSTQGVIATSAKFPIIDNPFSGLTEEEW